MAIGTFAELSTAILGWAERSDLSALVPDFISLADARIRTKLAEAQLRLREMETTADLTPSSGVATLPTDFMAMIRVQSRTSPTRRLEYKSQDWLDEAYPAGDSGYPSFYSMSGSSLRMYPLTTSDIRITYWAYPAPITSLNTTNWLLTKYPNVYLYASLIELELYALNKDGAQVWATALDVAVESLSNAGKTDSFTSGTSKTSSTHAQ
jgi:hypothetical protein